MGNSGAAVRQTLDQEDTLNIHGVARPHADGLELPMQGDVCHRPPLGVFPGKLPGCASCPGGVH